MMALVRLTLPSNPRATARRHATGVSLFYSLLVSLCMASARPPGSRARADWMAQHHYQCTRTHEAWADETLGREGDTVRRGGFTNASRGIHGPGWSLGMRACNTHAQWRRERLSHQQLERVWECAQGRRTAAGRGTHLGTMVFFNTAWECRHRPDERY